MTSRSLNTPEGQRFAQLLDDYYRAWFRYHPEAAVAAGVSGFERLLTPFDEEAAAAVAFLNDELLLGLNELDRDALDVDARLDLDVIYGAAWLENRFLLEVQPYRVDPGRCLPVEAIYQLTILPVADFQDALVARLAHTPSHLIAARRFLQDKAARIPRQWLDSAISAARHGAAFLRELPAHPKVAANPPIGLDGLVGAAGDGLVAFADFLARDIGDRACGDFACGADYFADLLRYRHFLDVGVDELHAFGTALLEETAVALREAASLIVPGGDIAAAAAHVRARHPAAEDVIDVYRTRMRAAREFVRSHNLVTLPAHERLDVIETPLFLRHQIPFAAYSEPTPNDPRQQGYYYVTPPADEAQLQEHNEAGIPLTCVHEAWPGHHLQFVTANGRPAARTLPRLLNPSATLYEGWALYCEQMMCEQGFANEPAQRFLLLKDRLWRALRVVLDIELHTRGLSVDGAADRMTAILGFPRAHALADLAWYTKAPAVPLGYATGAALINALRRTQGEQPGFVLKEFHDRLLSVGSIALPLVVRRAFGEEAWQAARRAAFAGGVYAAA